jgi:hypothetical protein
MTQSPDRDQKMWEEKIIKEIEKAVSELDHSEIAFQWVGNDPDAVDAAISRIDAAINHYNFLIKQAKRMGISADRKMHIGVH